MYAVILCVGIVLVALEIVASRKNGRTAAASPPESRWPRVYRWRYWISAPLAMASALVSYPRSRGEDNYTITGFPFLVMAIDQRAGLAPSQGFGRQAPTVARPLAVEFIDMNAKERYYAARAAGAAGRYEEALREHIWFHDHALEEQPSLYGVRLSYALSDWIELANRCPPALVALKAIRDAKPDRLVHGDGDQRLFHDVRAINEQLEQQELPHELFVRLREANPALTEKCADLAMAAIVRSKDFELARRLVRDPHGSIRRWSCILNEDVADLANEPADHALRLDACAHYYVTQVRLLLAVFIGVGESEIAESLGQSAVAAVESPSAREAVHAALVPKPGV